MPRKKETITLSIPPGTKEQLEAIADRLGIRWGKSPSISGLLVAIAQQQVEIGEPFKLNLKQVKALQQATLLLIDTGYVEEALTAITLIKDRGKIDAALHQSLLQQVSQTTQPWRKVLDRQIAERQPFQLFYRNSQQQQADEYEEFNVCYGEIQFVEKRFYLQAWCEEENEREPIPELKHNRCFRLDRIIDLVSLDRPWRDGLGYIEVQLHFYGGLAKAYERKPEDLDDRLIDDVRQVIKPVSNPFWLMREVRRYGKDCIIVAPERLRQIRQQELISECQAYGLEIPAAD